MSEQDVLVRAADLQDFVAHLLSNAGMDGKDAEFFAECVVRTNLWGIDSHGVLRIPTYLEHLSNGGMNPARCCSPARSSTAPRRGAWQRASPYPWVFTRSCLRWVVNGVCTPLCPS